MSSVDWDKGVQRSMVEENDLNREVVSLVLHVRYFND